MNSGCNLSVPLLRFRRLRSTILNNNKCQFLEFSKENRQASVATGTLQIRWTVDGDKDAAALGDNV